MSNGGDRSPQSDPSQAPEIEVAPSRGDFAAVKQLVVASSCKVVVLDDDPTGTQTVNGIDVLTDWSEETLATALRDPRPCFFILTNSRSLPESEAVALTRNLAANLQAASRATGQAYTIVSRSDSTLRGHFPAEIDVLAETDAMGYDGVIVAPAFFEAGRVTIADTHYVLDGTRLVPAGETEFARDATFGYRSSNVREWVEEKTHGRVAASEVASISMLVVRQPNGAEAVRDHLLQLRRGTFVVVNAVRYEDLEVFVHGLLLAEASGRCFLCRTAASFVRVRAAVDPQPLLAAELLRTGDGSGGLVVVGSYTDKTTAQLEALKANSCILACELDVGRLADADAAAAELEKLTSRIEGGLRGGRTVVVFTSRARKTALGQAGDLTTGRIVSDALVKLVRGVHIRPRFLIAKGGITSSDLAVRALKVRRALILGQAEAGIPVWQTGPESLWPGLNYIVFPGNVGQPGTLRGLVDKLER